MLKVVELFAGIGSQTQALKNKDIEHEVVAISEIDSYAIQAYEILHGEVCNLGDISKVNAADVPDCDLITYSWPCQDVSAAGAQAGLAEGSGTRSSMLWECKRIIESKMPSYLLMENVKNLISRTHEPHLQKWIAYLDSLGYNSYMKVINSVDHATPQSRERVFLVSCLKSDFEFPEPRAERVLLSSILDCEVAENLWMNDRDFEMRDNISMSNNGLIHVGNLVMAGNDSIKRVYSPNGVCPTLTTMTGGHRQPKVYIEGKGIRKLSPKECWLAMGFSEEQFSKVEGKFSNAQLYKMAGNSIAVPVLEDIFEKMFKHPF